jgi:uncharacterized membrane protein
MATKQNQSADNWIYGTLGIPIGFLLALIIPELIFYTTKPGHFTNSAWYFGTAGLIAITLGVSSWIIKSRKVPRSRIIGAIIVGLFASSLVGFSVSRWFADAHDNYWESVKKYGEFFELITPLSYLVLLSGLFSYIGVLLFLSRHSPRPAEQGVSPNA